MSITLSSTDNKWSGVNEPDEIVIHHWDDPVKRPSLSGVVAHFKDPASQVSAHYVVSDKTVVKMMDEHDAAWHAMSANRHSIGIEIDPNFPGDTYKTTGQVVADIRSRWGNLPLIRHRDVPGNSTTCPGDADLNLIERYARESSTDVIENFEQANLSYWVGEHRNYYEGAVSKEEVEGRIGKKWADVLGAMIGSPLWLHQNDLVKFGDQRLQQIDELLSKLQAKPDQKALADLKQTAATLQEQIAVLIKK